MNDALLYLWGTDREGWIASEVSEVWEGVDREPQGGVWTMSGELKQKILDLIYAGDWSFRDKDYNKVEPNFFQFGLDNEDMIVEAIIETVRTLQ